MAVIHLPDMDSVTTRTELMAYFKALRRAIGAIVRHIATDMGMLRAMLKAQDERYGTRAAGSSVRPMLWAAAVFYSVQKSISLTAQRVHLNYAPENRNRQKSARTQLDMDR